MIFLSLIVRIYQLITSIMLNGGGQVQLHNISNYDWEINPIQALKGVKLTPLSVFVQ